MGDIFISYARADQARVEKLADALERAGYAVWWDRRLDGGVQFSKETEARAKAAKAIVAVWTETSVNSMWVADEATIGRDAGTLVPISLDAVEPPIGFRQIQAIAFQAWSGGGDDPAFAALERALASKIGAPATVETLQPPAPPPSAAASPEKPCAPLAARPVTLVAGAAALAVIAVLAFMLFAGRSPDGGAASRDAAPPAAVSSAEEGAIAIIPFTDISPDGDHGFLAAGIAEEVRANLAAIPGFRVSGRTSSRRFADGGAAASAAEIGAALGVRRILEGSVFAADGRVRVKAALVDAATDFTIWSGSYDEKIEDVFAIQDRITEAIVDALAAEMTGAAPAAPARAPISVAAYEEFLRAREALDQRTGASIEDAMARLALVTAEAPGYAPAHAALAKANAVKFFYAPDSDAALLSARGTAAARRALDLDPENAEALAALGGIYLFYDWDFGRARNLFSDAITQAPNHPDILNLYTDFLNYTGDYDAAAEIAARHTEIEPLLATGWVSRAQAHLIGGDLAAAKANYERAIEIGGAGFDAGPYNYAMLLLFSGDYDGLADWVDAHASLGERRAAELALASAILSGETGWSARLDAFANETDRTGGPAATLARLFAIAGDDERAAHYAALGIRRREPMMLSPYYFVMPEDWPDMPKLQAALKTPELETVYALRRENLAGREYLTPKGRKRGN